MKTRLLVLVLFVSVPVHWGWAQAAGSTMVGLSAKDDPAAAARLQREKHSVLLVSLDGFRWDYANRYGAKNLLAMAADGASAPQGMIPSYPSTAWPNDYTLVTGLYPEHHGIVAMNFFKDDHTHEYRFNDPKTNADGSWYGGTPLWVLAEQQGMRSACMFWPGSEAAIKGVRPSYSVSAGEQLPNAGRVAQVLAWLQLPAAARPHFIVLSFADGSDVGRVDGPDGTQMGAAVASVDAMIGRLRLGIAALGLPVDLVVVSGQGMIQTQGNWIDLDKYADLKGLVTAGSLLYADNDAAAQKAYEQLKIADSNFKVYRRVNVPKELHYDVNLRVGDPVVVATAPVAIRAHGPGPGEVDQPPSVGSDGFDPAEFVDMRAVFYAEGPDIRPGIRLKPFENVNVFPFIAEILGLHHEPVDGSAAVLLRALKAEH